ncbi:uncharacterized protein LOC100680086 [Nasonia vitripennis]|uniref:ascorbate ferrireductase (transmembrane) n=1 Tax=Nasonia vitripennis TaxID=7425 RepID=A0A7M7H510_NASVI|nr:uncharacterized protein LOC100680086 [Nasonia vitripennis]
MTNQQISKSVGLESSLTSVESTSSDSSGCNFWQTVLVLCNVINHVLVLLTTGYLAYLSRDLSNVTNLHVLLCTIGYVLLMSEAIVTLTGENVWSRKLTRRSNSHLHWILQVLGAAFSIAGVYVMYAQRRQHFRSVHALAGIASVGAIIGIFFTGLPALFAGRLRKVVRPVIGKFFHNFLGILCFVVGMVSQIHGYKKGWLIRQTSSEVSMVMIVTTAMITVFSLIGSLRSLWEQFKGHFKCR